MKPKSSLILGVLALVLMVIGGSPAGASAISTKAAPSTVAAPLSGASSSTAFLCSLNVSLPAEGSAGQPAPLFKTTPPPCGICSDFACQTHSVGAECPGSPVPWHCYDVDRICSQDGNVKCRCLEHVP